MSYGNKFTLGVGLAHSLEQAMNRNENGIWTPALVHKMSQGDTLGLFRKFLLDRAKLQIDNDIIDLNVKPFEPEGLDVDGLLGQHEKGGSMKWNPNAIDLYVPRRVAKGYDIEKDLRSDGYRPVNANLLDFFLENPHTIPEKLKGHIVFFFGTQYSDEQGKGCVRCMNTRGMERGETGKIEASDRPLSADFGDGNPIVVFAR
jgi:hypothetical protein